MNNHKVCFIHSSSRRPYEYSWVIRCQLIVNNHVCTTTFFTCSSRDQGQLCNFTQVSTSNASTRAVLKDFRSCLSEWMLRTRGSIRENFFTPLSSNAWVTEYTCVDPVTMSRIASATSWAFSPEVESSSLRIRARVFSSISCLATVHSHHRDAWSRSQWCVHQQLYRIPQVKQGVGPLNGFNPCTDTQEHFTIA